MFSQKHFSLLKQSVLFHPEVFGKFRVKRFLYFNLLSKLIAIFEPTLNLRLIAHLCIWLYETQESTGNNNNLKSIYATSYNRGWTFTSYLENVTT